ncbi:F-box domain, cyclin-like protein [Cordyceps fumosorosea ARSEF 2679]|uniref:F-box domain, cyclin-like protein n=1 Tax=Cordyceps fumosorosea (strain ARSEF 2679) TaxID=1081104 RepID=A0A162JHK8_CORFA|nr:F-box domain, cyclin-like protein [Cordyceps fumosorosea ARSEF 2679]OAA44448.1 F-box domain, cyclin-like protein [Cordyceps fumosorosea ARSEF 2679]
MERMPVEVLQLILSCLDTPDLARVAKSCRALSHQAEPLLYQNLDIRLHSGNPALATDKHLCVLLKEPQLRELIRHVAVENEESTLWTAGHTHLLKIILSTCIDRPTQIRSFSWKPTRILTDAYFPNLAHLDCANVRSQSEVGWIQWHVAHCLHLKSLSVGSAQLLSPSFSSSLFSALTAPLRLHTLSLRAVDLSYINPAVVISPSIRSLHLQYCAGMDAFFFEVAKLGLTPKLRSFRALGIMSMALLQDFLFTLADTSHLEELSLCLGAAMHPICLHCIEPHAPALRLLILDFRAALQDVDSAIQYSADQFEDILARFPRLTSLGLPLQLKDPSYDRYRRAEFKICTQKR